MKDLSTHSLPTRAQTLTRSRERRREGWRSTTGWALALALMAAGAWLLRGPLDLPEKPQAVEPGPVSSAAANTRATRTVGVKAPPSLRHHEYFPLPENDWAQPWLGNDTGRRTPVDEEILLSISGRVLDTDGNPMVGAAVHARSFLVEPPTARARRDGATYAGADGYYTLTGLPSGEYRIAADVAGYARTEITARTGARNADLVLQEETTMWVYGQLTGQGGSALQGARVTVNLSPPLSVSTDAQGWYEVPVRLTENVASLDLRFEHPRHVAQSRRLEETRWAQTGEAELNVALEPISLTTTLTGRLETTAGEPVAGETLSLYSPSLMRGAEGMSGKDGTFSIPDVVLAPDYMVAVRPRGNYKDLTIRGVGIGSDAELWIQLTPLELGTLVGRMTDVHGNPVPNFTLIVHNTTTPGRTLPVTSDALGNFAVENAPLGELVFETPSLPSFSITTAAPGLWVQKIPIVLDLGPYELDGRVLDADGFPIPAREVALSWARTHGGVRSTAIRRTVADADGYFWFAGLGPGPHLISVQAPGFETARVEQDVGANRREIVVKLTRAEDPVRTAWRSNGAR